MKIAVDARIINMSGIGTYIKNLMKNDCYDIALGRKDAIKDINNNVEIVDYDCKIYSIKEQLKFPYKELRKLKPDVLHIPHYNVPVFYRGRMVVTIHDLTHLILPEFLPNKFAKYYAKFMIKTALRKAEKVITVSENTKKDILRMFKVNPEKIEVIYNGVGKEFIEKDKEQTNYLYEKYNIPKDKKLLMYVGNLKPHKNLERLITAYSKINDIENTRLLLVGKAFEKYNVLEEIEKQLGIEKNVIHTGMVEQEELVDLYNLVDLFVFPSLYEGFGLPVLEALSCGTPVVCSNNSSIPEVGGNMVKYFDAYNTENMKKQIEEELNNPTNIDKEKLQEWLNKFSWHENAKKVKEIFEEI